MASAGSFRNYKVGPKNHWRRTFWNEVLSRTAGREKRELVLYLAGPQDLDRGVAISKGVPPQNLIAIDSSQQNVDRVREKGVPAISADMIDVLRSWPDSRKVCAVLLDFCSGLTEETVDVYDLFERAPLRNAVVLVNFMRGRDPFTKAIRDQLTDSENWPIAPCHAVGGPETFGLDPKHRALQFLTLHAIETWDINVRHHGLARALNLVGLSIDEERARSAGFSDDEQSELIALVIYPRLFQAMRPKLFSYKSGNLTFDSAVFQPLTRGADLVPPSERANFDREIANKYQKDLGTTRKIGAMLAVRTGRLATSA